MFEQTHYRANWTPGQLRRDAAERQSGYAGGHWNAACFFETGSCSGRVRINNQLVPCECPCHDGERAIHLVPEPVHACPPDKGDGLMPCCGRSPFEVLAHRITADPTEVTCKGASK
jgi:hypothetical protein